MPNVAHLRSLYEAIEALPAGVVGELINGQLHTQPRPSGLHALTASNLGADLVNPFSRGRGGPGGWWIIDEPEVHLVRDAEVTVPDIAGWRRERMPRLPHNQRFTVVPDWICEVLSPSTASKDREVKLPMYARYGVRQAWLIDPMARRLEVFALENGQWSAVASFGDGEPICVRHRSRPFLWIPLGASAKGYDERVRPYRPRAQRPAVLRLYVQITKTLVPSRDTSRLPCHPLARIDFELCCKSSCIDCCF